MATDKEKQFAENWIELYQRAILELDHSRLADRIREARHAISMRIEKLQTVRSASYEKQLLADALNGLATLEHEKERYQKEEKQEVPNDAIKKPRAIPQEFTRIRQNSHRKPSQA